MDDSGVYLFSVRPLKTVVDMFPGSAGVHTGRTGGIDPRSSLLSGSKVLPVDGVQPRAVDTPGLGAVDTARTGAVETAGTGADVQLLLGHGLQLVQAPQLLVEGVHEHQGSNVEHVEDHPGEECEEIVAKDHIVDDGRVAQVNHLPNGEDGHGDHPGHEPGLILQPHRVEEEAGCEEERDGCDERDYAGEEEDVPHMMISNINKLVRHPVVASVDGARPRLLQAVNIKDGLKTQTTVKISTLGSRPAEAHREESPK